MTPILRGIKFAAAGIKRWWRQPGEPESDFRARVEADAERMKVQVAFVDWEQDA